MTTRTVKTGIVLGVAGLAVSTAQAGFEYTDFSSVAGLNLIGSAQQDGDELSLTQAVERVAGAAWYNTQQQVADGFIMEFEFQVTDMAGAGADGVAFVIQNNSPFALGGTGGALGYGSNYKFGESGIVNSLAVEIDLWNNFPAAWSDLGDPHVAVHTGGPILENNPSNDFMVAGAALASTDPGDGHVAKIRVEYEADGDWFIFVDDMVTPALTLNQQLNSTLLLNSGSAWVGLTGATGGITDVQKQNIVSWRFAETVVPAPGGGVLAIAGGLIASRRRRGV